MLKSIPQGTWSRMRAGANMGRSLVSSGLLRVTKGHTAASLALGNTLALELDELKGLAMKVGQILSYMDVGLPEPTRQKLEALQKGCKGLPLTAFEESVQNAMGAKPNELFDELDSIPVAAASIGQVHRGTLWGKEVAIKLRYPGIEETLVADLAHLNTIAGLASLATNVDGKSLVQELKTRTTAECDYTIEARSQTWFADFFADDTEICVPHIYAERSCDVMLTSEWVSGVTFADLEGRPQDQRNKIASALIRFLLHPLLTSGRLQADPHPGNFIFLPGKYLFAALDFGCVRDFRTEYIISFKRLLIALRKGDKHGFRGAVDGLGLTPDTKSIDFDNLWEMLSWMFEPYLTQGVFHFSENWWRAGQKYTNTGNKNARTQGFPPEWLWLNRTVWGLHALLVRLDARVETRTLVGDLLEGESSDGAYPWHGILKL